MKEATNCRMGKLHESFYHASEDEFISRIFSIMAFIAKY
jgi:hypothetical protein